MAHWGRSLLVHTEIFAPPPLVPGIGAATLFHRWFPVDCFLFIRVFPGPGTVAEMQINQ